MGHTIVAFVTSAFSTLTVACGSDGDEKEQRKEPPAALSCAVDAEHLCFEYVVSDQAPEPIEPLRQNCLDQGGALVAACPRAGAQGKCTSPTGAAPGSHTRVYYYGLDAEQLGRVRRECDFGWSDTP